MRIWPAVTILAASYHGAQQQRHRSVIDWRSNTRRCRATVHLFKTMLAKSDQDCSAENSDHCSGNGRAILFSTRSARRWTTTVINIFSANRRQADQGAHPPGPPTPRATAQIPVPACDRPTPDVHRIIFLQPRPRLQPTHVKTTLSRQEALPLVDGCSGCPTGTCHISPHHCAART